MVSFIQRHADKVLGVLSGFDRLVFRGGLRGIARPDGMKSFLAKTGILFKEFKDYAARTTELLKEASLARALQLGRPVIPVQSSRTSKEAIAVDVARRDKVEQGLICVLKCQEPSLSFKVSGNHETKRLELRSRIVPCQVLYHYYFDPTFGFMNARIQTYFPFTIYVCMNGREWLAREMDRAGIRYDRRDNCFASIEDGKRAQELMNDQLKTSWASELGRIARQLNPAHKTIFKATPGLDYYWYVHQSEWATDIMFRDANALAPLYRALVHHGITSFSSPDVMRFLGRKVFGRFEGEVVSDFKDRPEGVRVKHRMNANSVKIYDKQGSVLRVETTMNNPTGFRVLRPKEGDPKGEKSWRPLRKGIADTHRRAEVSQAVNDSYLAAVAAVESSTPIGEIVKAACRPTTWKRARVRALKPWSEDDLALIKAVNRGEFTIGGLRNRDLQDLLYSTPARSTQERRRRAGRVTRQLRLLRAHGVIQKVTGTHRYKVTDKGREILTAVITAHSVSLDQIRKVVA